MANKTKKKNSKDILLSVKNLHVYYDAIHAIKGVDFEVKKGSVVTLVGSNGAGKTTILKTLSHLLDATEDSELEYHYESDSSDDVLVDLRTEKPHIIVEKGIGHVPEGRRVFAGLTVQENLQMGAYTRTDKQEIAETLEKVYNHFPRLLERKNQLAGTLSGGEQQMLAMGRALMGQPKILLLDEPSMGLAPILVDEIFHIIETISASGVTILLVEQNANRALHVSDYGYVLETGKIIAEGPASDLLNDPKVIEAYLSA